MDNQRKISEKPLRLNVGYLPVPGKPQRIRDVKLEHKTLQWIINVINEIPKCDFDEWIQDGKILCRLFNEIVFNSVPIDITESQISKKDQKVAAENRVKQLIAHIREFGVPESELFHFKDLCELRNIPRVCKCLKTLKKMTSFDSQDDVEEEDNANN